MTPAQLFGVVVRTIGLVLTIYGTFSSCFGLLLVLTEAGIMSLILGVVAMLVGLWMLRVRSLSSRLPITTSTVPGDPWISRLPLGPRTYRTGQTRRPGRQAGAAAAKLPQSRGVEWPIRPPGHRFPEP